MEKFAIKLEVLCEIIFNRDIFDNFLQVNYHYLSDEQCAYIIQQFQKIFLPHFNKKFKAVYHNRQKFLSKFQVWLQGYFEVSLSHLPGTTDNAASEPLNIIKGGRPCKSFDECSNRAKKYKVQFHRETFSQGLIDAASSKPANAHSIQGSSGSKMDPDLALALIAQAKLSKYQYEVIRKMVKDIGHNIFPSYNKILEAKKKCYPENISLTEHSASVPLQALLDHTTKRIVESCPSMTGTDTYDLVLHTKWGFDGASGQSQFSQNLTEESASVSDAHVFSTAIVPLMLTCIGNEEVELWKNSRPSSTMFCRPVRFACTKETPDIVIGEKNRMENEIQRLRDSLIESDGHTIRVKHQLYFTMFDGKVAQIVTETSSASNCVICGAKPSEMNKWPKLMKKELNVEALKLGMSTMHARIKFMEYVLHLSYNLPFKCWRVNESTKSIKKEKKIQIQNQFREKLGLLLDIVKQGAGTTNTGNASRRFFENYAITSEITTIDENLIKRFKIILELITSNYAVDSIKFGEYALETAQLAIKLYPWYYMPASVHKILLHGQEIIEQAVFPIGTLSEEAQEARNKEYKYFRTFNTRKSSREATNEDIIHTLLISSDPFLSKLRPELKIKKLPLSEEAKCLLKH